jgi:hypothetical protein
MIAQEVARLLGIASACDPRIPQGDADVLRVWTGLLGDVDFEVAARAVAEHYRATDATITPSVLVAAQRADARRRRNDEALAELKRRPPAFAPDVVRRGIDRCVAELAAAKGLELEAAEGEATWRRMVLDQRCPHCGAAARQPCTSGGKPLTQRFAHPGREDAARSQLDHA